MNPIDYACPVEQVRPTFWDRFVKFAHNLLALFGLASLTFFLGFGTGYLYAKEVPVIKKTDCGSCRYKK